MNEREKVLFLVVLGMAGLSVAYVGAGRVSKRFQTHNAIISQLQRELQEKNTEVLKGQFAQRQMEQWESQSLSSDREEAQSLYKSWLSDWVKRNELAEPKIKVESPRDYKDEQKLLFRTHSFSIAGKTDLRRLTKMMYEFETADQLHRMRSLTIQPLGEKQLEVLLAVDAVAMPASMNRKSIGTNQELLAEYGTLEENQAPIFQRNMFGPANNAPRLDVRSSYEVALGSSLQLSLKGTDRDEIDKLSFHAKLDELPGATLRGDRVDWRPRELGDYYAEFEVIDDGFPALSNRREVKITVVDPPPPPAPRPPTPPPAKPQFDFARYTQLNAIIVKSGVPTAWLWIRPTDERLKVKVGESFKIGELEGVMTAIDYNTATFESRGLIYQVAIREFVGKAKVVGKVEQPVSTETDANEGSGAEATTDAAAEQPLLPPLEELAADDSAGETTAAGETNAAGHQPPVETPEVSGEAPADKPTEEKAAG